MLTEIIKEQTAVLFMNLRAQIEHCSLDCLVDGIPNSRYVFHAIHSLDKWFINPEDFAEPDISVCGIPPELSVISPERHGYVNGTETAPTRQQLRRYAEHVEQKTMAYLDTLDDDRLSETAGGATEDGTQNGGGRTRLALILAQFRHLMWHMGASSAVTFARSGEWPPYFGYKAK